MEDFSTEEVHVSMKIGRKETGQASESSDHQSDIASKQRENMRIDIIVEDNAGSTGSCSNMEKRLKSEIESRSQLSPNKWPRIPRVPQMLRDTKDFKKQFEPRVISVGPYHHRKPELEPAELLKRQMTQQFVQDSALAIEALYSKIASEISDLRNCYSEKATEGYDNDELVWMMLVDGCSLLQFIDCYTTEGKLKDLPFKYQIAAFVQQDLFLLENQLPFRVLELLLELGFKGDERMQMIERFISRVSKPPAVKPDEEEKPVTEKPDKKPSHLLDLLRRRLVGIQTDSKTEASLGSRLLDLLDGFLHRRHLGKCGNSFRNANELKAAGICFVPDESGSLRDISFESDILYGYLKLPQIIIDDSTKSRFLNLMAYEMCPEAPHDSVVTSYICFLDSLIDDREDVKELRRQSVLRNFLGSDEELATLFNEITTDLVPDSDAYKDVKEKIQKHYDNVLRTHITEGRHTHFSSPWTTLAFLGAIVALGLSVVQTIFAILSR